MSASIIQLGLAIASAILYVNGDETKAAICIAAAFVIMALRPRKR